MIYWRPRNNFVECFTCSKLESAPLRTAFALPIASISPERASLRTSKFSRRKSQLPWRSATYSLSDIKSVDVAFKSFFAVPSSPSSPAFCVSFSVIVLLSAARFEALSERELLVILLRVLLVHLVGLDLHLELVRQLLDERGRAAGGLLLVRAGRRRRRRRGNTTSS